MATAAINPAYLLDPSLYGDQQAIDQQRQLASLLMQGGLTPMGGTESVGGVAIRRSPMEGVAKLAQLLSGQGIQRDANTASQDLMQRQTQVMAGMFGGGQPAPAGSNAPAPGQGAPQPVPQSAGNATPAGALGLPGMSPMQSYMAYAMGPDKYMESFLKGYTPNDTTISARQGGVDPVVANRLALIKSSTDPKILGMQQAGMSPEQIYGAIYGEAAKAAEIERKPNSQFVNPMTGASGIVPKIPENTNITGPVGPNGQVPGVAPIAGASSAVQANTASAKLGTASATPTIIYGPDGTPQFSTELQNLMRAQGWTPPAGVSTPGNPQGFSADSLREQIKQVQSNGGQPIRPEDQPKIDREVARLTAQLAAASPGGATPEQRPGVKAGADTTAKGSAEDAVQSWNELHKFATNSAPRNIGLLQSIQQLADKTLVGPGSDKAQFVNGILNTLGITPGSDQAQNYQIMSKNLNMLVGSQRMGAQGGGSDALQNLLQAANPNNKEMNGPALKEAAEELIAYNRMQMAFDRALPNPAIAGSQASQAAETKFAALRDPRIWQLEHASDDKERIRILSLVPTADRAVLLDKVAQARKLRMLD